jgi:hypothetical protein
MAPKKPGRMVKNLNAQVHTSLVHVQVIKADIYVK